MPAIYHEGSWLGNATDPEVLVKDTVGWTGKNLLKNTQSSKTINGITVTVNSDGTITTNGTATTSMFLDIPISLPIGEYVFSGTNNQSDGSPSKYYARLRKSGGIQFATSEISPLPVQSVNGSEIKFKVLQDNLDIRYQICIYPAAGAISNLTFYPMLRKADIIDPTYEPYHESVEEEIEQIYADNGVLGAKNKFAYPWATKSATLGGITFTDNDGYSLTVNGTATSNTQFDFFNASNRMGGLETGRKYILSGAPETSLNTNDAKLQLTFRDSNDTASSQITVVCPQGGEIEFTIPEGYRPWYFVYYVRSGVTINNLVVKPMLRLASDPDDTYQPYAMTNRELTEKKIDKDSIHLLNVNLNDVTETGLYYIRENCANSPDNIGYSSLRVQKNSNTNIHQAIFGGSAIYSRLKGSNGWSPWYKFTGTVVS